MARAYGYVPRITGVSLTFSGELYAACFQINKGHFGNVNIDRTTWNIAPSLLTCASL